MVIPQGWGFFTRDPREDSFKLYRADRAPLVDFRPQTNSSSENLWGLRRNARALGILCGSIYKQIEEKDWVEVTDFDPQRFKSQEIKSLQITTASENHTLCGQTFILVRYKPIPWAWAASVRGTTGMQSYVAKIHVNCSKQGK